MIAPGSRYLVPLSAGLAVGLSSTALSGVIDGAGWAPGVAGAIAVVVVLGLLGRAARLPVPLVLPIQLAGLALLVTALYGTHRLAGVVPTPATVADLAGRLSRAVDQIETGIPPVPTTPELGLLVMLGFGLVMLVVDPLVDAGHGPAVCGLVLLGGYTVPTALAPDALPAWTMVVGALGYALHLMVTHRERMARRGILAEPPRPPAAASAMQRHAQRLRAASRAVTGAPLAGLLTAVALVLALGLASLATAIGTDGRFAGHGHGHARSSDTSFGLNPFTTLRGELSKTDPHDLLRVRGLPGPQYLRALSLTRYVPDQGWQLPDRRNGVDMNGSLPSGMGIPVNNPTVTLQIQNVAYKDRWLPLYGTPMAVAGLVPGRWQYDVITNTAFTDSAVTEPAWTERAALPDPGLATLQSSENTTDVDPAYLAVGGVSTSISDLARAVTRNAASPFEKAVTLNRYFLDPASGFHYSLQTAPGSSGDALRDFLFRGRTGYCEQFASAMAVMLREIGVPSRVAIGFTSGKSVGDAQVISTADAHAWVEAYFSGVGWLTFDPTPLDDGRTVTPSYVEQAPTVPINVPPAILAEGRGPAGPGADSAQPQPSPDGAPAPPAGAGGPGPGQQPKPGGHGPTPGGEGPAGTGPGGAPASPQGGQGAGADQGGDQDQGGSPDGDDGKKAGGDDGGGGSGWPLWLTVALWTLLGIAVVAALVCAPAGLRELARRRRLASAARGGIAGAEAAWREVLAEFQDRGADAAGNDTVRGSARTLSRGHQLEGDALTGMKTVVGALERGWYAPPGDDVAPPPDLVGAVTTVRGGLDASAPLSVGARLWPRSVVPHRRAER